MRKLTGHRAHQVDAVSFFGETPDVLLDMPFGPATSIMADYEDIFLLPQTNQPFPIESVARFKQRISSNEGTNVFLVPGMQPIKRFER